MQFTPVFLKKKLLWATDDPSHQGTSIRRPAGRAVQCYGHLYMTLYLYRVPGSPLGYKSEHRTHWSVTIVVVITINIIITTHPPSLLFRARLFFSSCLVLSCLDIKFCCTRATTWRCYCKLSWLVYCAPAIPVAYWIYTGIAHKFCGCSFVALLHLLVTHTFSSDRAREWAARQPTSCPTSYYGGP